ncbi:MAG: Rieske (2Fe-2S) protein, partial [Dongiaceae bacterium]
MSWASAISLDRLRRDGRAVARIGSKQIALFDTGAGIYACNNRCPHEGYPLREGKLDQACLLTCNWHNWKFDLRTGANLYGGDRLRIYPTRIVDDTVWVDVSDPSAAERTSTALTNLHGAFDDHEYDRMARELARLRKAGSDPAEAVAAAIGWSHERLEFGTTHAYAASAGWLQLHDRLDDDEARLICLLEAIGHMAWDTLREPAYPYRGEAAPWDASAFRAAIEAQDEDGAVARVRGALAEGRHFADLEQAFTAAALSHYADFGHSLIYVVHTRRLIARLGAAVELPLLLALVRSLVYATREEFIPEFRRYAAALEAWPRHRRKPTGDLPRTGALLDRSINDTLATVVEQAAHTPVEALYGALLGAGAFNLLRFDARFQAQTDGTIAQNVGWLDFTHAITFANAVRLQCGKFPELWPPALLQMACFVGRNTGFVDRTIDVDAWRVDDRTAFDAGCIAQILDHGEDQY